MEENILDDLMTIDEVADLLKVGKATLYNQVNKGQIPSYKFAKGKVVYLRRSELCEMFKPNTKRNGEQKYKK